jgi:hypothetical protein
MVHCIASIDTSFLVIQPTSLHDFPSSAFATMKLSPLSYQLMTLNATILTHSSPSYTLRKFCWIFMHTRLLLRLRIYRNFEAHELSYEQWKSVLHLSTRWGFASLRKLALKSIRPPTSHDQLVLARTYSVNEWVLPALTALCSRSLPLSLDEARQMDIEDVILVAAVREEIRGGALQVNATDIPRHVEMTQADRLVSKAYSDKLKDGSTGQESGSTMDPVSKSVNASTLNLLGGSLTADSASGNVPAESGESQLSPMSEAPQADKLEGNRSEEVHSKEHLTLMTNVSIAAHMATARPTTAGDLHDRGGRSEGEGRGGRGSGDKVTDDQCGIPIKGSTSVRTPVAFAWHTPVTTTTKKKKNMAGWADWV